MILLKARRLYKGRQPEERREEMRQMVKSMETYISTYKDQAYYEDYTTETFLNDMLYGIGVAIYPEKYQYSHGFEEWKDELRKFLGCHETTFGAWVHGKDDARHDS